MSSSQIHSPWGDKVNSGMGFVVAAPLGYIVWRAGTTTYAGINCLPLSGTMNLFLGVVYKRNINYNQRKLTINWEKIKHFTCARTVCIMHKRLSKYLQSSKSVHIVSSREDQRDMSYLYFRFHGVVRLCEQAGEATFHLLDWRPITSFRWWG